MKARLTLMESNHPASPLRTPSVEGDAPVFPTEGKSFRLYAKPLIEGATIREVTTSPVVSISVGNEGIEFTTRNSTYKLEVLE